MGTIAAANESPAAVGEWLSALVGSATESGAQWWSEWAAPSAVGVVGVVAVVVGLRVYGGWRARRQRRTVVLKPSAEFDPSSEEVLRYCGQLTRVRHATGRVLVPRSTRTVRVRLVHAGEGRMAQLLEGPAASEQILRQRGFAQVELGDPDSIGYRTGQSSEPGDQEPLRGTDPAATGAATSSGAAPTQNRPAAEQSDGGAGNGGRVHAQDQRLHRVPDRSRWAVLDSEERE